MKGGKEKKKRSITLFGGEGEEKDAGLPRWEYLRTKGGEKAKKF